MIVVYICYFIFALVGVMTINGIYDQILTEIEDHRKRKQDKQDKQNPDL